MRSADRPAHRLRRIPYGLAPTIKYRTPGWNALAIVWRYSSVISNAVYLMLAPSSACESSSNPFGFSPTNPIKIPFFESNQSFELGPTFQLASFSASTKSSAKSWPSGSISLETTITSGNGSDGNCEIFSRCSPDSRRGAIFAFNARLSASSLSDFRFRYPEIWSPIAIVFPSPNSSPAIPIINARTAATSIDFFSGQLSSHFVRSATASATTPINTTSVDITRNHPHQLSEVVRDATVSSMVAQRLRRDAIVIRSIRCFV